MRKILAPLVSLLFISLLITACDGDKNTNHGQMISTTEAYQVWSQKDKSSFVFLDVRTLSEYQDGHIPDALNIPIQTLPEHLQNIPKNKTLYVYCESGVRASKAAALLNASGFKHVYNYEASMRGWRSAGYPITAN